MAYTQNPHLPQVRWEAIQLIRKGWSTRDVARRLGYSQSAVSIWVRKYGPGWYGPAPTRSSRPKTSPRALPPKTVEAIIDQRLKRRRCGQVVHEELKRQGIKVSLSSVQRVLGKTSLLRKRSPWKRPHDATLRPMATHPGALLQADTVHFRLPDGSILYVYTLIDLFSRWAYAKVVPKIGAAPSVQFVREARKKASFTFEMIQTDNGSEFSTWFTHSLKTLGIKHRHGRVRHSNDQAFVERFNRSVQEECLDLTAHTIPHFRKALREYLPYYNGERLHMGIAFKTPNQMLELSARC